MNHHSDMNNLGMFSRVGHVLPFLVVLSFSLFASCTKETKTRNYGLPVFASLGSCPTESIQSPPSGCVWAFSTDAIVWGTLEDIRLTDSPAYIADDNALVDVCDGSTNKAMEMEVRIERTIRGDLDGEVTVHLGQRHIDFFSPRPLPDAQGGIEWVSSPSSIGKPMGPGMKIGLALHWIEEHKIWSLMGEPMFGINDTETLQTIAFQRILDECHFLPPKELEGMELDRLIEKIGLYKEEDCTAEAAERKQLISNVWGRVPDSYMAAVCMPRSQNEDPVPGSCATSSDCEPTKTCVNGWCQ